MKLSGPVLQLSSAGPSGGLWDSDYDGGRAQYEGSAGLSSAEWFKHIEQWHLWQWCLYCEGWFRGRYVSATDWWW